MSEVIGVVGLVLILTAYFLNYQKIVKRDSRTYDALNLFGGLALFYYSVSLQAMAFIVLQAVWTLIALYHIVGRELKHLGKGRKAKK